MRSGIAITLILAGTFLLCVPAISDHFYIADQVRFVEAIGDNRVSISIPQPMSQEYRMGLYFAGVCMVGVAIARSRTP